MNGVRTDNAIVAKEFRFSVVMYGGVSLAIYMNGVSQELLHMVRSTARGKEGSATENDFRFSDDTGDRELRSTEKVYRKVARMLNERGADDVRFIIDVISGTSAGGINGIFLAKALTDDELNFEVLQNMWVEEGALELLLNDKWTTKKTSIPAPRPPLSLLCSDRMYMKLLDALGQMSTSDQPGDPFVRELDLFVTTTDIYGQVVPLRLADRLVWERKYRGDFHFRFKAATPGETGLQCESGDLKTALRPRRTYNDLKDENNPFIAFAARCTSSFPFAFEPMQLRKLLELQETRAWDGRPKVSREELAAWERDFFCDYEYPSTGSPLTRPFGDGGYLNNKPFSYVVDMLGRHGSALPTERKLLYVEPSPEHPERENSKADAEGRAPNALINSFDALIKLPGYQPIHDDLQRVIERNRVVRKVIELSSAVTSGIARTAASPPASEVRLDPSSVGDFAYIVLRAYSTTDNLSKVLAEWFRIPASSSFYYGVRCIVRAWREAHYDSESGDRSAGGVLFGRYEDFLRTYDLEHELRKYMFVRQQINLFYCYDTTALSRLENDFGIKLEERDDSPDRKDFQRALIDLKTVFDTAHSVILDATERIRPATRQGATDDADARVSAAFNQLRDAAETFKSRRDGKSAVEYVLGIEGQQLNHDFAPATADQDENYIQRARDILPELETGVEAFASTISKIRETAAEESKSLVENYLASFQTGTPGQNAAKKIVEVYYRSFTLFDAALFPLMFDTDVGTPELISVIRVSPDDATRLFDQARNPGCQKLAGVTLGHFGAFLDRSFRTNDILWGRLDGAERIIRCLLPTDRHKAEADLMIDEAQTIIIEDFLQDRRNELAGVIFEIAKSLGLSRDVFPQDSEQGHDSAGTEVSERDSKRVRQNVDDSLASLPSQPTTDAFLGFLSIDAIRNYLTRRPPERMPERRTTAESITRAVGVMGGILQGLGDQTRSVGGVLIRIATLMWWLVEAAVPKGLAGHFFRKVFALLFLFEIVMVVGGTFLDHSAQTLGLKLMALTVVLWLVKDALQRFMKRGTPGLRTSLLLAILAVCSGVALFLVLDKYGPVVPPDKATRWIHDSFIYLRRAL